MSDRALIACLGAGRMARGIAVMFAYAGWNAATYVAGEMKNPTKDLGRALALVTDLTA